MRNTQAIVEAICNHTSFKPEIKTGLVFLKESNVDIVHWNALNEQEERMISDNPAVIGAFNRFSSSVIGPVVKSTQPKSNADWIKTTPLTNPDIFKENTKKQSEIVKDKVYKDAHQWEQTGDLQDTFRHLEKHSMTAAEKLEDERNSVDNTYLDILAQTEKKVGKENIKTYMEKISDDVQTFVTLVTLLTEQIVKEAWVNSPLTIQKVFGNRLYFLENPALDIRTKNVNAFVKEASTVLKLAFDVSSYFVLQNANEDIQKSVTEIWQDAKTETRKKLDATPIPKPVKTMFAFNEEVSDNFITELTNAVWESIPSLIETHGDDFFLIIESQTILPINDAFNSSRFQSYHPLFESMYYQLQSKKPFNWFLELEKVLVDDKEIEKNLTYCATELVKQQLANNADYLFPTVGKVAGFTAHKLLLDAQNTEDGLSELLGVKDSLWITSGYVPGTLGLILLLFNVASAMLFVAYAEDIVGFDLDKANPELAELPIWQAFKESAFDLKVEYENKRTQLTQQQKIETTSPRSAVQTGIKIK
jgi:hypothetical protein